MEINPIAHFHSPFPTKFGIPRQSGIVADLRGSIVFTPAYRQIDAIRGLDGFDYLWLVWGFSANVGASHGLTVRPPRLGGNQRMGVFATRSPFRPNNLGLSSVRLLSIDTTTDQGPVIHVAGADLMDGTPIYDIKPYLPFTDSHPGARTGFAAPQPRPKLTVNAAPGALDAIPAADRDMILQTLAEDPRPQYHDDPTRQYGLPYGPWDIHFIVDGTTLTIISVDIQRPGNHNKKG